MKKNNYVFLSVFILIVLFGTMTFFRSEKDKSDIENRELAKFPHLTLNSYLKGTYQDEIESAFSDQFWASGTIKLYYDRLFDVTKLVNNNKKLCKNNYYNIGGRYVYDCSDYMVFLPAYKDDEFNKQYLKTINSYSKLNDYIDTYYYFINTSYVYDFKNNKYAVKMKDIFKNNMKGNYKYSELKINDFNDFKTKFYKTDHHWNSNGSYIGYKDIMKMFNVSDVIKPVDKITFKNKYFYGSHATFSRKYKFFEDFTVNKYDYPDYVSYMDGIEKDYGKEEKYFNKKYDKGKHTGLYGDFYGGDHAELIFDFNNPDKDNILIIGNSFTNSINKLVSSHFNKTYIVDLRHYDKKMKHKFNILDYINKHNIDKVLVISDYGFYLTNEFELDWGNK